MSQIDEKDITKDDLIMQVVANSPGLSKRAMGRKCKELGLIGHENVIFHKLRKTELLAETSEDLKHYWSDYNLRKIMPLAVKEQESILKDKEIPKKDKIPLINKAWDKAVGEDKLPGKQETTYNIDQIQVLVRQGVESNDK